MTKEQAIEICNKIIQQNNEIVKQTRLNKDINAMQLTANCDKESLAIETVLSMLKEKDKTIAKYEKIYKEYDCYRWVKELDKKDKIIDLYIDELTRNEFDSCCQECCRECEKYKDALKHCIKQYFERKSEEC